MLDFVSRIAVTVTAMVSGSVLAVWCRVRLGIAADGRYRSSTDAVTDAGTDAVTDAFELQSQFLLCWRLHLWVSLVLLRVWWSRTRLAWVAARVRVRGHS